MAGYTCSICGAGAYYDGRCGDGPVLTCGCDRIGSQYVKDRMDGYYTNPTGAKPVRDEGGRSTYGRRKKRIIIIEDDTDDWGY